MPRQALRTREHPSTSGPRASRATESLVQVRHGGRLAADAAIPRQGSDCRTRWTTHGSTSSPSIRHDAATSIDECLNSRRATDSGPPAASVIVYTESPGSEGSHHALVRVSDPIRRSAAPHVALQQVRFFSANHMCADHHTAIRPRRSTPP